MLKDTGAVITEAPNNPKAYYRASSALIALSRYSDALDCITRGKSLVGEAFEDKQRVWEALEVKARRGLVSVAERTERERREKVGKEALRRAIEVSEQHHTCVAAGTVPLTPATAFALVSRINSSDIAHPTSQPQPRCV